MAASTPSLDSLIPHLLASKRSLSSITSVYRANEICSSTRLALEQSATTIARTSFLRSSITAQLDLLHQVQGQTTGAAKEGRTQFESAVRSLDEADERLRGTLDLLRETIIEAGLRPEKEKRRSLLDFVDESGVDGLVEGIKSTIDEAGQSIKDSEDSHRGFRQEVVRTRELLDEGRGSPGAFEGSSPVPDILHEMESYAREMAQELEGLVNHYDMCVSAIKHTEGGGDAAFKLARELPEGVDLGQDMVGPPEPINDEQRREMIRVVQEDAGDVEGAVLDIRNHLMEMERLYEQVETYGDRLAEDEASIIAAFKLLEDLGRKLPIYITQSQVSILRWDAERAKIDERLEELESLTHFYDGFLRAYDNLLIEIGRRKTVEQKLDKEVQIANARLERLYEDEAEEREAFRKEQGDFLPIDIWPGLTAEPLRFAITMADEKAARAPDISKSVIHRAIKRVHGER